MSLKFKALLKRKGITQTALAKSLDVSPRTVRNWVKANGTIPTFKVANEITKCLSISTYELYTCFINDPDNEDDENEFKWKVHDLTAQMPESSNYAPALFNRLDSVSVGMEGILRYQNEIIRFRGIKFCDNYQEKDLIIRFGTANFNGMILIDDSLNIIPLRTNDIKSWKIESNQFDNITVRVTVTSPLMAAMEQDGNLAGVYDIYITLWKNNDSKNSFDLSSYQMEHKDKEDVIPAYIKEFRKRRQLTQNNFAAGLLDDIKGKNVSKWENKDLVPNFMQIKRICDMYDISPEALFDAYDNSYFSKHSADIDRQCFDIGINYLFNRIDSDEKFSRFVEIFKFMHDTVWKPEETNNYSCAFLIIQAIDGAEVDRGFITDIVFKDNKVKIEYDDGKCIMANNADISIETKYNIQNYTYRFEGTYKEKMHYILEFSIFI